MTVTLADTVLWLHEEGLVRLAGVAARTPYTVAAYTIDITDGTVTIHPAESELGRDVTTVSADDLPTPIGTRRRLIVVGVTTSDTVLVVDLAALHAISIDGDRAERTARSWVLQLLLNPEITLTTNSDSLAVGASDRCRQAFIPGAASTLLTVDDRRPPATTVTLNSDNDRANRLELDPAGIGELYLGTRYWALRAVQCIDNAAWSRLAGDLARTPRSTSPTDITVPDLPQVNRPERIPETS